MESRLIVNLVEEDNQVDIINLVEDEVEDGNSSDSDVDENVLKKVDEINKDLQKAHKQKLELEKNLSLWERISNILIYTETGEKFTPGLSGESLPKELLKAIHAGTVTVPTQPNAGPTLSIAEWDIMRAFYNIKYEPKEEVVKTEQSGDPDNEDENTYPIYNVLNPIKAEPQENSFTNLLSQSAVMGYTRNNAFALPASPTREQAMPDLTSTTDVNSDFYESLFMP